jgi:hypothetical protein
MPMSEATPPVQEDPGPGVAPPETSLDAPTPAPADEAAASVTEPNSVVPPSSRGGSARAALRRVTGATIMVALVALLIGAGLGYAFGRATTSATDYDQAGGMMPGHMAPRNGPWYEFHHGQGGDRGQTGPGRGGPGANGQGGWSDDSSS